MANSLVLYEVKDQIAYITLNRPEKRNALNAELYNELGKAWERFEQDLDARVAILSGAGKVFCAGADVKSEAFGAATPMYGSRVSPTSWNGTKVLKPVVGAVHGYAIGAGYGLAVKGCDITVAAEGTKFAEIEARLGLSGLEFPYVPYMPFKISLEFFLTGEFLTAERAYELGIVNEVVPQVELMNEAIKYADILKKNAPLTLRALKYAHYKAMDELYARGGNAAREFETFVQPVRESEDIKEGPRAFFEKREPVFKGR